jgi:folate-binding protein YgfZ
MAKQTPLHEPARAAGAAFIEEAGWSVPAHFGSFAAEYESARRDAVLFDRSHHGKIEAAGNDAAVFLHNLSTNDVKSLTPGGGCEAFFCSATAKVLSYAHIYREPPQGKRETLWLDLTPGLDEKTFKHLDRYLISEDVTLTDHTEALAQMHLTGPRAAAVLSAALGEDPGAWVFLAFQTLTGGVTVRCTDWLDLPGYDLLCPAQEAASLWQKLLAAGAHPAGSEAWEVLRVEAGTPLYGVDIDDNTFAPEVGRTALAISYNKGCYLGQEPIVMARDRGVVQRSLVGLIVGDEPAPPGSLLFRDGKEVGRTTSSVRSPKLGCAVGLAYVRRRSQSEGTELELESAGSRRTVRVAKLPLA